MNCNKILFNIGLIFLCFATTAASAAAVARSDNDNKHGNIRRRQLRKDSEDNTPAAAAAVGVSNEKQIHTGPYRLFHNGGQKTIRNNDDYKNTTDVALTTNSSSSAQILTKDTSSVDNSTINSTKDTFMTIDEDTSAIATTTTTTENDTSTDNESDNKENNSIIDWIGLVSNNGTLSQSTADELIDNNETTETTETSRDDIEVSSTLISSKPPLSQATADELIDNNEAINKTDIDESTTTQPTITTPTTYTSSCSACSNGLTVPATTSLGFKTCGDLLIDAQNVDESSEECTAMKGVEKICCPTICSVCIEGSVLLANSSSVCTNLVIDAQSVFESSEECEVIQKMGKKKSCCSQQQQEEEERDVEPPPLVFNESSTLPMIEEVDNNGNPSSVYPLEECKGDCDRDSDCQDGLVCMQRVGNEVIPGCQGNARSGIDFCIRLPSNQPTLSLITWSPTGSIDTSITWSPTTQPTTVDVDDKDDREATDQVLKSYTTTFASDTTYAGNMFDIVALDSNIEIISMGINTYVSSLLVQVYTRIGSYQGYENDITSWTLVGSATMKGQGLDTPTMIDEIFNKADAIVIRKGSRQSFYITSDGPYIRSTKGNFFESISWSNANDIEIAQGVAKRYPMTDGTVSARIWNGLVQYHTVDESSLSSLPVTFSRGDLSVVDPNLGIRLCKGMSARVIAQANQPVRLANGSMSTIPFHSMPDGAAIIPMDDDGGYVYISNSEMTEKKGGVYGLYFNKHGDIVDYKQLLSGTTRNCSGGKTTWNTWLSCEEYGRGQCWQVDPKDQRSPQVTKLGGSGGNYEAVAVDHRRRRQPIFYVTEDSEFGALRRYMPPYSQATNEPFTGWDTLHQEGGSTSYLQFLDNSRFTWTNDEQAARNSQAQYYPNVEGVDFDSENGELYFVSKKKQVLFVLNLLARTYTTTTTKFGTLQGGGEFKQGPDHIATHGDYLYLTEDSGTSVGAYALHKPTGKRYAMFEAYTGKYHGDETTGLQISSDGTKMYAAFQDCGCSGSNSGTNPNCGCLLEFSRDDGRSFDGATVGLKFHSSSSLE